VIRSRGELYEKKQVAKGDLLVAKARAEVDRLTQGVLANSIGAEIYVARELAPILGSLKGGVVQNLDPYDLEQWVKRLGVTEAVQRSRRVNKKQRSGEPVVSRQKAETASVTVKEGE
jgi:hypothetical protein